MFASSAASVRCVSSMIVVLNAKFALYYLQRTQTKKTVRNEKARKDGHFLLVKTHKNLTSIAALTVHTKTSLLYTFQQSIQANRNINQRPNPNPKHSKFAITNIREKPVNFFYCSTRASTLFSAITLLTQSPLQKFPFLFIFIIPCYYRQHTCNIGKINP